MIEIEISGDIGLNATDLRRALRSGSREAIRGINRFAINQIPTAFTITTSVANKSAITKATTNQVDAELKSVGKRIELIKFKHNPTRNTKRSDRVTAEVETGNVADEYPAFIRKQHIFERIGERRSPIRLKRGASVPEMLSKTSIRIAVMNEMLKRYQAGISKVIK